MVSVIAKVVLMIASFALVAGGLEVHRPNELSRWEFIMRTVSAVIGLVVFHFSSKLLLNDRSTEAEIGSLSGAVVCVVIFVKYWGRDFIKPFRAMRKKE